MEIIMVKRQYVSYYAGGKQVAAEEAELVRISAHEPGSKRWVTAFAKANVWNQYAAGKTGTLDAAVEVDKTETKSGENGEYQKVLANVLALRPHAGGDAEDAELAAFLGTDEAPATWPKIAGYKSGKSGVQVAGN